MGQVSRRLLQHQHASTNKGVNLINPAQRQQQKTTRAQYSDFQLPD
jgi:hypothetical protein